MQGAGALGILTFVVEKECPGFSPYGYGGTAAEWEESSSVLMRMANSTEEEGHSGSSCSVHEW